MPIANYDKLYGGKKGGAAEAKSAMRKHYGPDKGDSVFYALANKRKRKRGRKG